MQKVGFGEGRGDLGTQGSILLRDAIEFTTQSCDLIKRSGGGVNIHGCGGEERVMEGVIDVATDEFPSPKDFYGLVN